MFSMPYIKQGPVAESLVTQLLTLSHFTNAISAFSAEQLLSVAKLVAPKRYQQTNHNVELKRCTSGQIMDHLYGVDHVVDLGGGVYVSIDTTVDYTKVASKIGKAQKLSKLRAAISIEQHFVLHVVGNTANPDPYVMARSINEFWEAVESALNGPPHRVRSFRLHVS